jgi:hypothetical protein
VSLDTLGCLKYLENCNGAIVVRQDGQDQCTDPEVAKKEAEKNQAPFVMKL